MVEDPCDRNSPSYNAWNCFWDEVHRVLGYPPIEFPVDFEHVVSAIELELQEAGEVNLLQQLKVAEKVSRRLNKHELTIQLNDFIKAAVDSHSADTNSAFLTLSDAHLHQARAYEAIGDRVKADAMSRTGQNLAIAYGKASR